MPHSRNVWFKVRKVESKMRNRSTIGMVLSATAAASGSHTKANSQHSRTQRTCTFGARGQIGGIRTPLICVKRMCAFTNPNLFVMWILNYDR
jgi:hypothetical protein